ncbi:MAG: hypothetical protein ACQEXX_02440 [Bacillota bacterium]
MLEKGMRVTTFVDPQGQAVRINILLLKNMPSSSICSLKLP